MPETPDNLYTLIGILITAIAGVTTVLVGKRSGRAGEDANRIDRGVSSVEAYVELTQTLQASLTSMQTVQQSMQERIVQLQAGQEVNDGLMAGLRERIQKMSTDLDALHSWKRAAIRYIIELRDHALRHSPGEALPKPPVDLEVDLRADERR